MYNELWCLSVRKGIHRERVVDIYFLCTGVKTECENQSTNEPDEEKCKTESNFPKPRSTTHPHYSSQPCPTFQTRLCFLCIPAQRCGMRREQRRLTTFHWASLNGHVMLSKEETQTMATGSRPTLKPNRFCLVKRASYLVCCVVLFFVLRKNGVGVGGEGAMGGGGGKWEEPA